MKKALLCLMMMVGMIGFVGVATVPAYAAEEGDSSSVSDDNDCTTILPKEWCDGEDGAGIYSILALVLNILTAGVGILATVGLVISGIQYIMTRDDSGKVAKVKSRIFNIVIGLLAYGVMWFVLEWLIPGGVL